MCSPPLAAINARGAITKAVDPAEMCTPKRALIQTGSCISASCIDLSTISDTMVAMSVVIAMLAPSTLPATRNSTWRP